MTNEPNKRRFAFGRAAFSVVLVALAFGAWFLVVYPNSPMTNAWNPTTPLDVKDEFTSLTQWKLRRALSDPELCLAALDTGAAAARRDDFVESDMCHIRPQVSLSKVGSAAVKPLNTRCQTALRVAMWERHGIQPAAERHLDQGVRQITHFSSYNCREIRTTGGGAPRMSTHATADAIDISGFVLEDGTRLTLQKNWDGSAAQTAFFRDVRDSACEWFRVTLGPDYNALHADHFHLQHTGWGLCR